MKSGRGRVSPEFLQKIKDSVNLIEVVGEHVVLRKSGANHTGLCPFHSERSPSFSVSEPKQLFHCYGCKKSGDLVSFVMEIHGLSFPEAIEELAERAKVPLPKDWKGADGSDSERSEARTAAQEKLRTAFKLNRFVAAFYHQNLQKFPQAEQYFQKRGLSLQGASADLVRDFYLGAALPGWDTLAQRLIGAKAPLELAVELGLVRPSKKPTPQGSGYFDLFRNRALFPILDLRGRVAGFGGRSLPGGESENDFSADPDRESREPRKETPKYLNSVDSFVFQKGKLAYGLYQAQKHIREKDEVILVEGYFDVLALHSAGFRNAVAICGTSLTPDHLAAFRRLGKKVTLLLDGDKAGVAATERAMETGLEQGMVLYGAALPPGLDPDEVLFDQSTGRPHPEGVAKMASILGAAQPLLDSRIESAAQEALRGAEGRTLAVKRVAHWLSRYRDSVGRAIRLEAAVEKLGVSQAVLEQAMRDPKATGARRMAGPPPVITPSPRPVSRQVSRPLSPGPAPRARPAPKGAVRKSGLTSRDRILLTAFARGGKYSELIARSLKDLPARVTLAELFDSLAARDWVTSVLTQPGAFERFRAIPEEILTQGEDELDPQVRSTLAEALIAVEPPFEESEVALALERGIKGALERFSQQIMSAISQAQANKDAGLEAQLMKEYLDVKRKIKEFNSFYDEA